MEEQTTLDGTEYIKQTSDDWETPDSLFKQLDNMFQFTLDPCCQIETAKCKTYFTPKENGLIQSWKGHRVFMNCPYSDIPNWVHKAYNSVKWFHTEIVAALLPAWTDRKWFHDYIYSRFYRNKAEIIFLPYRVKFLLNGKEGKSPPFGSMIIVWSRESVWDREGI